MKCPVCNTVNLAITERQGIEIDYCPECRGVWLDRGELTSSLNVPSDRVASRRASTLPSVTRIAIATTTTAASRASRSCAICSTEARP